MLSEFAEIVPTCSISFAVSQGLDKFLSSETTALREEISAILSVAKPEDEVLLRLESPGGIVHDYGFAASQLARLKQKGIKQQLVT